MSKNEDRGRLGPGSWKVGCCCVRADQGRGLILRERDAAREAPLDSECEADRVLRDRPLERFKELDREDAREDEEPSLLGPLCEATVVGAGRGTSSSSSFV